MVVTSATLLVLMYWSMATSALVSSNHYLMGVQAHALSESATNIVIGQIRRATTEVDTVWVSQPGALRTFDSKGDFSKGYKLYSDDDMDVDSGKELFDDLPEKEWSTPQKLAQWTDLNSPLVRGRETHYPIADPSALTSGIEQTGVEGFDYEAGMVAEGSGKLPMPVRWIYVLEDGTTGTLDDDLNFVAALGSEGVKPTKQNPITGRMAFWTDDESCKVNLNTASEPTPWDVPRAGGKADRDYGLHQPAKREYQRFPGHPATTALSPVLLPGRDPKQPVTVEQKDAIYNLVPRIATGGSRSATRVVAGILQDGPVKLDRHRLLPSVDELVFSPTSSNFQTRQLATVPGQNTNDSNAIERLIRESRFFLTTHSRAPELNAFDMPRISIWPTASTPENPLGEMRTAFDDMIRFCATTGKEDDRHRYFFERLDSRSATHDYEKIPRNIVLYDYLKNLTSRPVPGYGGSLKDKWQEDRDQVLTEVFDYIRCTNLYDDQLKPNVYPLKLYDKGEKVQFTEGRPSTGSLSSWPGHGQVVPIEIPSGEEKTYGFGRFYTISEAGLLLICCGDAGGPKNPEDPDAGPKHPKGIADSNQPGSAMGKNKALPRALSWQQDKQERCLQAALLFELYCPAQGWTHLNEDITIEVEIKSDFTIDQKPIEFKLDKNVWQSAGDGRIGGRWMGSVGEAAYSTMAGGTVGFWTLADDRYAGEATPLKEDRGLQPRNSRDRSDENRRIYPFISEPFIVRGDDDTMSMASAELEVRIRLGTAHSPDAVDMASRPIVQTLHLEFPQTTLPVPTLTTVRVHSLEDGPTDNGEGGYNYNQPKKHNSKGQPRRRRSGVFHPSFWWVLNRDGIGIGDPEHNYANWGSWSDVGAPPDWTGSYEGEKFSPTEELFNGAHYGRMVRFGNPYWTFVNQNPNYKGKDVVRTLVPRHRAYRLVAAQGEVDADVFVPHRDYFDEKVYLSHHFSGTTADVMAGRGYRRNSRTYVEGLDEANPRESRSRFLPSRKPDYPIIDGEPEDEIIQKYGDFDNGIGVLTDGAYINKPDAGNRLSKQRTDSSGKKYWTIPYFNYAADDQGGVPAFFSPNRQVSSPVMFGSLPTGVIRGKPWQTLLFRPQLGHPGDAFPAVANGSAVKRGSKYPPDHVLLDLFWMPVVEPYAISEPFSTAGKVNLNYQMLPFRYLRRDTAMRAVMASEQILTIPLKSASTYKRGVGNNVNTTLRRPIDVDETLLQFEERFQRGEVFRMANEICDVHLVPKGAKLDDLRADFWKRLALTGDNSRERPYANLYPRVTTQSNVYRVHFRTQVIKKARSSDPEKFDPERDTAVAEYRGSTLIERYLDPGEAAIPDYARQPDAKPALSDLYRFRVISSQRFAP